MNGLLIVNNYVTSDKFYTLYNMFLNSAKKLNINLSLKKSGEILHNLDCVKSLNYDFILFYDKDILLAKMLEDSGFKVFNSALSIFNCDNKCFTYNVLQNANINIPKTFVAPKTFENLGYNNIEYIDEITKIIEYPLVLKEAYGSFGRQVYLINNRNELLEKIKELKSKEFLLQEFISNSSGRDVRINIVNNKVVASMLRYSVTGDFRSNITNGGHMKQITPLNSQIEEALKAVKALKLDFAGVDVLFGENNKPIICEVNSNPHFKSVFDCTGVDLSYEILKYIKEKLTC